jgi:hypothetical protein
VFGMPGKAIELHAAQCVLPPGEIARRLLEICPVAGQSRVTQA